MASLELQSFTEDEQTLMHNKGDKVVQFLTELLERDESPKVQAVLATGLAKMMLSGMVSDEKARTGPDG